MWEKAWKVTAALGAAGAAGAFALALSNRRALGAQARADQRIADSVAALKDELAALRSFTNATERVVMRWAEERASAALARPHPTDTEEGQR